MEEKDNVRQNVNTCFQVPLLYNWGSCEWTIESTRKMCGGGGGVLK